MSKWSDAGREDLRHHRARVLVCIAVILTTLIPADPPVMARQVALSGQIQGWSTLDGIATRLTRGLAARIPGSEPGSYDILVLASEDVTPTGSTSRDSFDSLRFLSADQHQVQVLLRQRRTADGDSNHPVVWDVRVRLYAPSLAEPLELARSLLSLEPSGELVLRDVVDGQIRTLEVVEVAGHRWSLTLTIAGLAVGTVAKPCGEKLPKP